MDDAKAPRRFRWPQFSLATLSLLIASLSLISSISQSYNYRKNIESVQMNVLRAENLRTCKEILEVFFTFRLAAEEANMAFSTQKMEDTAMAATKRALKSQVYRFGALGTHLANFTPDVARERYTKITWLLNDLAEKSDSVDAAEFMKRFAEADAAFASLNEDCAKSAQFRH